MLRSLVGIALLMASAGAFAKKEAAPKTVAEFSVNHGYVRVSVPQWELASEFALHSRTDGKNYAPQLLKRSGTRSYAGWLLAGEYDLVDTVASGGGRYPPIIVKPGQVTDLGVLLRLPLGGYEYQLVPTVDAEAELETEATLTELGPDLKSKEVIRWRPAELPAAAKFRDKSPGLGPIAGLLLAYDRKVNKPPLSQRLKAAKGAGELLPLAKSALPPRSDESAVDSAGNLYYGADLGQIRVRRADGSWDAIDTGTLFEVSAVEASGPHILAGNLRGQLLGSSDGGKSWRLLRQLPPTEAVLDIDRAGARWLVLTAPFIDLPPPSGFVAAPPGTRRPWALKEKLRVYTGTQETFDDLAELRDLTVAPAWYTHGLGASDPTVGHVVGDFYLINVPEGIAKLNLQTMTWSTANKPEHRVDSIRISDDGRLITAKRLQGAFTKLSVSSDMGATWQPYSRPPYTLYDAVLDSESSGSATRWNAGAFSARVEFYAYDAKLADWRKTYDSPEGCVHVLRDEKYRQRFCLTSGGSILDYRNGAWLVEFALE